LPFRDHVTSADKHQPDVGEDEKQEGTVQFPSSGLLGLPPADGDHKCLLLEVNYEGVEGSNQDVSNN
jgi:hypothetical protein